MPREAPESPLPDPKRFDALVLPHLDAAYNLARWLTRDAYDAEDVVQDACVRALKYMGSLEGGDARGWFLKIVRNAFYDWLGRNRPGEIVHDENETVDGAVDITAVDRPDVLQRADARVLHDVLGIMRVARQPARQVVRGVQVRQDQVVESAVLGHAGTGAPVA